MLFHIKQSHAPRDCPYGKGGSTSLFDGDSEGVTILGYWLSYPQHTTYLVVQTDDIDRLHAFLHPGTGVTTCEITPVSDHPVPLPH
jgi:hypothetical protein